MQQSLLKGFYLQDLLIEPASGRVSGPGVESHLKPKAVEVLLYLAERPFELVERDELIHAVWGEDSGSSEALNHVVSELRNCCNDHASSPTLIQTVPRRGYRLLQKPQPVDEAEPLSETTTFQVPDDGSFIGNLMRRGVVQAGAAYMVFGWALIQVADLVTPILKLPAWLPSVITYAAVGGFPIVLVLAWMLERSEGRWLLDRGRQSGKLLSGLERNYLSIILAYGIAGVGALAYQMTVGFDLPGDPEATLAEEDVLLPVNPNSIAVLKFLNISGNETGEIFSQGLGEDILDRLARIPGLAVSSRGDSWSLPENASSDVVRERLRVAYFLEGSVRVIDDELRVVVQLIESSSGFHVFSRSFETDLDDHMGVQRSITNLAVANLRIALPEDTSSDLAVGDADPDLDAYVLYRRGKAVMDQPHNEAIVNEAIGLFQKALEMDPDYSAAHAGICRAHVALFRLTNESARLEQAESACGAALAANPNLDVVYTALGSLRWSTGDVAESERAYRHALQINPNDVQAMQGLAAVFERNQQLEEAEYLLQQAIELQPGNWRSVDALGGFYYYQGRYADAAHAYRQVVFLDPDNWQAHGNLGSALMMMGDMDAALEAFQNSIRVERSAVHLSNLGVIYYYVGEYDRSVEMHRQALEEMPADHFAWLNLGDALRFSSQQEQAADAYRRAIEISDELLVIDPNSPLDLCVRAWATAATGDEQLALRLIDRALNIAPNDPYVLYYDGLLKNGRGEELEAIRAFQLALEMGYPAAMLAADPLLSDLHDDVRFERMIGKSIQISIN